MLDWRIYYSDESTFDSSMGSPEDAPSFGVIAVVYPDPDCGRGIVHRFDWYYYHPVDKTWWGVDVTGLHDALLHNLPLRAVKHGRLAPNAVYNRVLQAALHDPDFPIRSARGVRETPP